MIQAVLLSGRKEVFLDRLHVLHNRKITSPDFESGAPLAWRLAPGRFENVKPSRRRYVGGILVLVYLSDGPPKGRSLVVDRERDTQASLEHLTIVEGHPQLPFAALQH